MRLSLDKFFDIIGNEPDDYVVRLAYRYHWEEDYTISNEILEFEGDTYSYVWLNDWNEEFDFVYVIGFIKVSDVIVPKWKGVL